MRKFLVLFSITTLIAISTAEARGVRRLPARQYPCHTGRHEHRVDGGVVNKIIDRPKPTTEEPTKRFIFF